MSIIEYIEKVGVNITTAIVVGCASFIGWIIRNIATNGRRLSLLEAEMKHRELLRQEDREALKEVRDGVKRLEGRVIGRAE